MKITSPKDVKEIAIYLEKMNAKGRSHIGFCGEQREEIYDSLMDDFSDLKFEDSFLVAYNNQSEIIGVIGLNIDLEGEYADIWGPFASDENMEVAQALWDQLLLKVPQDIKSCHFFINKKNVFAKEFALNNNAQYGSADLVLNITRDLFIKDNIPTSQIIEKDYYNSFTSLHDEVFPKTYFNSQTILSRLNNNNNLLIFKENESEIKGYVYIEAKPEHNEGDIEYVAVSKEFKGQGIGKILIIDALEKLFSYPSINEITICVSCENVVAVNLYKSVGFKEKYALDSYDLSLTVTNK